LASPGKGEKQERSLNELEKRFLDSAVDRLIPPDQHWPGARQAGVVNYIDLQMAGAWGRGELLYRHGPFRAGTPSQGFQLEYTPAEIIGIFHDEEARMRLGASSVLHFGERTNAS
jgi:hypothetical protein